MRTCLPSLGLTPAASRARLMSPASRLTGKDSVREQPDAFVRRKSQPYLRAQTTGTTGRPTSIAFSSQELRVYCALQAISHLLSGDIQADDVVLVSTSGRGVLGNLCLAGACAHVGAVVTMGGLIDPGCDVGPAGGKAVAAGQARPGQRPVYLSVVPGRAGRVRAAPGLPAARLRLAPDCRRRRNRHGGAAPPQPGAVWRRALHRRLRHDRDLAVWRPAVRAGPPAF